MQEPFKFDKEAFEKTMHDAIMLALTGKGAAAETSAQVKMAQEKGTRKSGATSSAKAKTHSTDPGIENMKRKVAKFVAARDAKRKDEAKSEDTKLKSEGFRVGEGKAHHNACGGAKEPARSKGEGKKTQVACQPENDISNDLGGIEGLPKPRTGVLDNAIWKSSVDKAKSEVCEQFNVANPYYSKMCNVGRQMMLELIRIKAQDIYDYRCGKQVYRKNRKKGS